MFINIFDIFNFLDSSFLIPLRGVHLASGFDRVWVWLWRPICGLSKLKCHPEQGFYRFRTTNPSGKLEDHDYNVIILKPPSVMRLTKMIDYTTENESSDIARCEAPGKCFPIKTYYLYLGSPHAPLLFRVVHRDIKIFPLKKGDDNRYNHFDY